MSSYNKENLGAAAVAAIVSALGCGLAYTALLYGIHFSFLGYSSLGIGFGVGMAVRQFGKASGVIPGIIAAVCAAGAGVFGSALAVQLLANNLLDQFGIPMHLTFGQVVSAMIEHPSLRTLILAVATAAWAFHTAGGFEELQGGHVARPAAAGGSFGGQPGGPDAAPVSNQFAWMNAPVAPEPEPVAAPVALPVAAPVAPRSPEPLPATPQFSRPQAPSSAQPPLPYAPMPVAFDLAPNPPAPRPAIPMQPVVPPQASSAIDPLDPAYDISALPSADAPGWHAT